MLTATCGTSTTGGADVLTLETVKAAVDELRLPGTTRRSPWPPAWLPIITSPYLTTTRAVPLTRWGRVRVWIEDLADAADVYYHFPRVERSITEPMQGALLIGGKLYCHPSVAERIRALAG